MKRKKYRRSPHGKDFHRFLASIATILRGALLCIITDFGKPWSNPCVLWG